MTSRVDNTPKSQTSGAPKPEGLSSLRLSIGFLGVGHMGPSKLSRVKHKSLHHKVVKDLGMISGRTTRSLKKISSSDRQGQIDAMLSIPSLL
jgi:hypothetical protein